MAAPDSKSLKELSGKWYMNKSLSDDIDEMLQMQGVSWWMRTAISVATITLSIKEYVDEEGKTHIDIEQTATGGIKGTTENRTLDWTERPHEDHIFGKLVGKSRWTSYEVLHDDFFKRDWLPECDGENGVIHAYVVNKEAGWEVDQVWGFEEVEGKRYYVRHVACTKGEKVERVKLVYDYWKELDA
ncbi:MAG: hypothetical protein M1829_005138 [Trizodia sp. TS-e1964]|nr:MAG: hypothetical protein M1829_005138 [Trizodia sp. TS-e1964]